MKKMKFLIGLSLMTAFTSIVHAGGGTTTTTGGFTFRYNVGSELNYHAYGMACQVGTTSQPKGTIVLGQWWVFDLGRVAGIGTVTCPKPIVPKGQTASTLGVLFFAHSTDVGGKAFTHPVVDVQIFTPKWYNGFASIQVIEPDGSGNQLYFNVPFSPFSWDLSGYVWDVPPVL